MKRLMILSFLMGLVTISYAQDEEEITVNLKNDGSYSDVNYEADTLFVQPGDELTLKVTVAEPDSDPAYYEKKTGVLNLTASETQFFGGISSLDYSVEQEGDITNGGFGSETLNAENGNDTIAQTVNVNGNRDNDAIIIKNIPVTIPVSSNSIDTLKLQHDFIGGTDTNSINLVYFRYEKPEVTIKQGTGGNYSSRDILGDKLYVMPGDQLSFQVEMYEPGNHPGYFPKNSDVQGAKRPVHWPLDLGLAAGSFFSSKDEGDSNDLEFLSSEDNDDDYTFKINNNNYIPSGDNTIIQQELEVSDVAEQDTITIKNVHVNVPADFTEGIDTLFAMYEIPGGLPRDTALLYFEYKKAGIEVENMNQTGHDIYGDVIKNQPFF